MTPFVADPDFTLYVGDVSDVLAGLPDESVHCVVTSPPYWGLRDYGTGSWAGGDPDCDHRSTTRSQNLDKLGERYSGGGHKASSDGAVVTPWRFVLPRWFRCWRETRHHPRTFVGSGRQWTECYCGLRCFEMRGGPSA